jgi:hypothetical protein
MGLRETLDGRKDVTMAISGLAIVFAVGLIVYESRAGGPKRLDKAFYSDDDGQTYFVDAEDKLFPFDHNGKQAYRASVFKCSDGTIFVGYLARYSDRLRPRLQQLLAQPYNDVAQQLVEAESAATEVKKPGASTWYPQTSPRASSILLPICPNGGSVQGIAP